MNLDNNFKNFNDDFEKYNKYEKFKKEKSKSSKSKEENFDVLLQPFVGKSKIKKEQLDNLKNFKNNEVLEKFDDIKKQYEQKNREVDNLINEFIKVRPQQNRNKIEEHHLGSIIIRQQEIQELKNKGKFISVISPEEIERELKILEEGKFILRESTTSQGEVICYCKFGGKVLIDRIPKEKKLKEEIKFILDREKGFFLGREQARQNVLNQIGKAGEAFGCQAHIVSSQSQSRGILKEAPVGTFTLWRSNSMPGVVNFEQKLSDGEIYFAQIPQDKDIPTEINHHIQDNFPIQDSFPKKSTAVSIKMASGKEKMDKTPSGPVIHKEKPAIQKETPIEMETSHSKEKLRTNLLLDRESLLISQKYAPHDLKIEREILINARQLFYLSKTRPEDFPSEEDYENAITINFKRIENEEIDKEAHLKINFRREGYGIKGDKLKAYIQQEISKYRKMSTPYRIAMAFAEAEAKGEKFLTYTFNPESFELSDEQIHHRFHNLERLTSQENTSLNSTQKLDFGRARNFISTKNPTNSEELKEFLDLFDSNNANFIMITKRGENSFPSWNETMDLGNKSSLTPSSEEVLAENSDGQRIVKRTFTYKNEYGLEKQLTQLHYENWPDEGIPDPKLFNKLQDLTYELDLKRGFGISCQTGRGPSAAFIASININHEIAVNPGKPVNVEQHFFELRAAKAGMLERPDDLAAVYSSLRQRSEKKERAGDRKIPLEAERKNIPQNKRKKRVGFAEQAEKRVIDDGKVKDYNVPMRKFDGGRSSNEYRKKQ